MHHQATPNTAVDVTALELLCKQHVCALHSALVHRDAAALAAMFAAIEQSPSVHTHLTRPDARAAISLRNVALMWHCIVLECQQRPSCLLCVVNRQDRCGLTLLDYARVFASVECERALERYTAQCGERTEAPPRHMFECPVCLELLWQPVTSTCEHRYCRTCFHRFRTTYRDDEPPENAAVRCPLCRGYCAMPLGYGVDPLAVYAMRKWLPAEYAAMCEQAAQVQQSDTSNERFDSERIALDTALELVNLMAHDFREKPLLDQNARMHFHYDDAIYGESRQRDVILSVDEWIPMVPAHAADNTPASMRRGYAIQLNTLLPLIVSPSPLHRNTTAVYHYLVARYVNSLALRLGGRFERNAAEPLRGAYHMHLDVRANTTLHLLACGCTAFLHHTSIIACTLELLSLCTFDVLHEAPADASIAQLCAQAERWLLQRVLSGAPTLDDTRCSEKVAVIRAAFPDELPTCLSTVANANQCDEERISLLLAQVASNTSLPLHSVHYAHGAPLFARHHYTLGDHIVCEYDCTRAQLLMWIMQPRALVATEQETEVFLATRTTHYHLDNGDARAASVYVNELTEQLHDAQLHRLSMCGHPDEQLLQRIQRLVPVNTVQRCYYQPFFRFIVVFLFLQ